MKEEEKEDQFIFLLRGGNNFGQKPKVLKICQDQVLMVQFLQFC